MTPEGAASMRDGLTTKLEQIGAAKSNRTTNSPARSLAFLFALDFFGAVFFFAFMRGPSIITRILSSASYSGYREPTI